MSCNFKFKFIATIRNGVEKTWCRETETYSLLRADVEKKLAEMRASVESLHPGEKTLMQMLEQCLANPRAKKITIIIKREMP